MTCLKFWSMGIESWKSKHLFVSSMWTAIMSNTCNAVFRISQTSIEYGPKGHVGSESGAASELSLGPYPFSKNG